MSELPVKQMLFIAVMAVLLMIIVPILQSRTGKSMTELLFGVRKKQKKEKENSAPVREPRINNGTKGELTAFVAQLLRFTQKNGMRLVAPGTIAYKGQTARVTAFIVAPSGIIGIYCLGFGGKITGVEEPAPWKQHMNGEDKTFENPLKVCREQQQLIRSAMDEAGIAGDLDIVTVFTNARASLYSIPSSRIYTQKNFMDHLSSTSSLRNGSLDVNKTAQDLAVLADVKGKRNSKAGKKNK